MVNNQLFTNKRMARVLPQRLALVCFMAILSISVNHALSFESWYRYNIGTGFFPNDEILNISGTTAYGFTMYWNPAVAPGYDPLAFMAIDKIRLDPRNTYPTQECLIYSINPESGPNSSYNFIMPVPIESDNNGSYCAFLNSSGTWMYPMTGANEILVYIIVGNENVTSSNLNTFVASNNPYLQIDYSPFCGQFTTAPSFVDDFPDINMTSCSPDGDLHLALVTDIETIVVNNTYEISDSSSICPNNSSGDSMISQEIARFNDFFISLLPWILIWIWSFAYGASKALGSRKIEGVAFLALSIALGIYVSVSMPTNLQLICWALAIGAAGLIANAVTHKA